MVSGCVKLPDGSFFSHIPKCGGTWVSQVLVKGIPGAKIYRPKHGFWANSGHAVLADLDHAGIDGFRFAFVRHPAEWWRSYYRYRMGKHGWVRGHEIDDIVAANTWDGFIENILAKARGYVGEMFTRFVGPPSNEFDFIGRQETLARDLGTVLDRLDIDTSGVELAHPRINSGKAHTAELAVWTPGQWGAVCESEQAAIERFGYAP